MIFSHRQYVRAQRLLNRLYTVQLYKVPPEKVFARYGIKNVEESIRTTESEIERYSKWLDGITPIDFSIMDNVAEQLVMARLYCGLTQEQLAEKVGTTRQQINRLERTLYITASWKFLMSLKAVLEIEVAKIHEVMAPHEELRRQRYAARRNQSSN